MCSELSWLIRSSTRDRRGKERKSVRCTYNNVHIVICIAHLLRTDVQRDYMLTCIA